MGNATSAAIFSMLARNDGFGNSTKRNVSSALHTDVRSAGDALVRDDPRVDLERVRCPALVLHGARDRQVPLRDGFEYARRLHAPLRVIADCGHLLIGERPGAVVDAISDWVGHIDELPVQVELVR